MTKRQTAAQPRGNSKALVSAFLKYRSVLARVISRIVKPQDIEDIVQETFIRSFDAAGKQRIRHPHSFMLRVATNLALNHVTKADYKLTDHMADFSSSDVYLVTETLESQFESTERFVLFCRAVRKLPVQCRRAFILKKVYGLSQKEIADYLGISQSTVEKHVAKGLMTCMERMEKMGYPIGSRRSQLSPIVEKAGKAS